MTEEGFTAEDLEWINEPFTKADFAYIKTLKSNQGKRKEIQESFGKKNGKGSIVNVKEESSKGNSDGRSFPG